MDYRIDLFAVFIFLGIIQAVFLSFFYFSGEHRKVQANVFMGLILLALAANSLEVFLMYTGYIVNCLYMVDFSEPIALAIGPCFYLVVVSNIQGIIRKRDLLHFVFPLVYLILVIPFFLAPEEVKFNSWVEAYQLHIPFRDYDYDKGDPRIFWVTDHHTLMTMLSLVLYLSLSLVEVVKAFRLRHESFFRTTNPVLRKLRAGVIQVGVITAMILVIKFFNRNDSGDHIFAAYISIAIYTISFTAIKQSGFFRSPSLDEPTKYKNSTLTADQQKILLNKLLQLMDEKKPFLRPDFSLPDLAHQLGTTVHTLSQVINEGAGKNFFEMTAHYRVHEAKRLLHEQRNIKVEEIAEQVGYNSKSSFNTAFKKITGQTPSEFRKLA